MTKRVILVHGWEGSAEGGWRAWLKKELEKRGFEVIALSMPNPKTPDKKTWVDHLINNVGEPSESDFLVGHSLGCITILRFLENLPEGKKVGGVVLVAGFGHDLEYPDYKGELSSFFDTLIDWEKIKRSSSKFIAIHSDNDPWVPQEHNNLFKEKLGVEGIIERDKFHYGDDDGILESETILNAVLKISS